MDCFLWNFTALPKYTMSDGALARQYVDRNVFRGQKLRLTRVRKKPGVISAYSRSGLLMSQDCNQLVLREHGCT